MVFSRIDALGQAFAFRQPTDDEQWSLVHECVSGCPTEAVGIASRPLNRDLDSVFAGQTAAIIAQIRLELSYKDSMRWQSPTQFVAGVYEFVSSSGMQKTLDIESGSFAGRFDARDFETLVPFCRFEHRCDLLTGFSWMSASDRNYLIGRIVGDAIYGHHFISSDPSSFTIHTWSMQRE